MTTRGRQRASWAAVAVGVIGLVLGLAVHSLAALTERSDAPITFADVFVGRAATVLPSASDIGAATQTPALTRAVTAADAFPSRAGGQGEKTGSECPSAFIILMLLAGLTLARPTGRARRGARILDPLAAARARRWDARPCSPVRLCVLRT